MSEITRQQYADLAVDAYITRSVTKGNETIRIGGNEYKVAAVWNNPKTGYYGAVYQDVRTNDFIAAHRGTAISLKDLSDGYTDLKMVTRSMNNQSADAEKLTRMAISKAEEFHRNRPYLPKPSVTHTGHSLGGTHVQIQTYRFGHEGVTFNAYGAVRMHGVRQGNGDVINYVKAADAVSAANPHYGKVIILAEQDDLAPLKKSGYNNNSNTSAYHAVTAAARSYKAHSSDHFVGKDSILSEHNYTRARQLAEANKFMISDYRGDVATAKTLFAAASFANANLFEKMKIIRNMTEKFDRDQEKIKELINSAPTPKSIFDSRSMHLMQDKGKHPHSDKTIYADANKLDLSKPLASNASSKEFREYGFAALLADDKTMQHSLDSLLASNINRGLQQNTEKMFQEQESMRLAEEQSRAAGISRS
ncbi:lipase [Neisseria sp.]